MCVKPRRPSKTNAGTETASNTTNASISKTKQKTSLEVRGQLMRSNQYRSRPTSIYMLSVMDFDPKGTISKVRVHAGVTLVLKLRGIFCKFHKKKFKGKVGQMRHQSCSLANLKVSTQSCT